MEPVHSDLPSQKLQMVRSFRNADPFVPFVIVVDDGRRFKVIKPYQLGIAPGGRELCFAGSAQWFDRFPTESIKEVVHDAG